MKILIYHNYYQNRGGEGQAVFKEKELLESKGYRVIFFSKDNQEINNYTFSQKARLCYETVFSRSTHKKVIEIVREEEPDIAHIHNVFPLISPSVYYALKKMKIPVVQTVHNYRFLCPNGLFLNDKGKICEKCKNGNFFNAIVTHFRLEFDNDRCRVKAVAVLRDKRVKMVHNQLLFFAVPKNELSCRLTRTLYR